MVPPQDGGLFPSIHLTFSAHRGQKARTICSWVDAVSGRGVASGAPNRGLGAPVAGAGGHRDSVETTQNLSGLVHIDGCVNNALQICEVTVSAKTSGVPGITMDSTVLTGIIGSATTIGAIILTRWLDRRALADPKLERFDQRKQATPSMYKDMEASQALVFLGISNTKLHDYLSTVIRLGHTLPWRRISIFFARDDVGVSWEHEEFGRNVLKSVLNVAEIFCSNSNRDIFPGLESVVFFQSALPSYYGGSLFEARIRNDDRFVSLYVVNYIPTKDADARTSFTLRLSPNSSEDDGADPFQSYLEGYRAIASHSSTLYALDQSQPNLWDKSAESWDRFERSFPIYASVMNDLCDFAGIGGSQTVLDVGCGSGWASQSIAMRLSHGRLFLLDNSTRMLSKARSLFTNDWQQYRDAGVEIQYVLSDASQSNPLYGAAASARYDRIVFHFSFQHVLQKDVSIETLARRWKPFLARNGEIILAIHNKCILCDTPPGFHDWDDEFRKELQTNFVAAGLRLESQMVPIWSSALIEEGFCQAGLSQIERAEHVYARSFEDRAAMWQTPAIAGSLAILEDRGMDSVKAAVENAYARVKGKKTMPMTVVFFRFAGAPDRQRGTRRKQKDYTEANSANNRQSADPILRAHM